MSRHHSSDPTNAEDLALLERVCSQDEGAHRVLFDRYYARVFAFILRRLRDPELTEETTADVFFEIWRSAERFTGESRVSTWIFGIAQFKAMSAHRARSRGKRSAVLPTNVEILHAVPDDAELEGLLGSRAELRALLARVEELPVGQRQVVEMAFLDELEYDEIAERLGVSVGTVKSRIARARATLRKHSTRQRDAGDDDSSFIQGGMGR